MLIKMLSRSLSKPQISQLLKYINEGRESFEQEQHFITRHNTVGNTTLEISRDFEKNNKLIKKRKGRQVGIQHIILSFHPKEKHLLNNEKLFSFSQKFAELMDFDRAITFGRVHYEKHNVHLHFAVSASIYGSGKSRRISKAKLKEVQQEMNRYQQREFPELKHSLLYLPELKRERKRTISGIPLPEKMQEVDGSIRAKIRGQKSKLEILRNRLLTIAKKFPKEQDFIRAIQNEKGLEVYHYRNRINGIKVLEINRNGQEIIKKYRWKRLAIDLGNLQRDARLNELEKIQNRDNERSLER